MANANVYSRALMDHVSSPDYKYKMDEPTLSHEGINPSCGDDLVLDVRLGEDESISHMPARVKCAELAWRTLDEMLAHPQGSKTATTTEDGTDENGNPVAARGQE